MEARFNEINRSISQLGELEVRNLVKSILKASWETKYQHEFPDLSLYKIEALRRFLKQYNSLEEKEKSDCDVLILLYDFIVYSAPDIPLSAFKENFPLKYNSLLNNKLFWLIAGDRYFESHHLDLTYQEILNSEGVHSDSMKQLQNNNDVQYATKVYNCCVAIIRIGNQISNDLYICHLHPERYFGFIMPPRNQLVDFILEINKERPLNNMTLDICMIVGSRSIYKLDELKETDDMLKIFHKINVKRGQRIEIHPPTGIGTFHAGYNVKENKLDVIVSEQGLKSLAYFNVFDDKPRLKSTNNKKVNNLFESQPRIPNDQISAPSENTHLLKPDNQLDVSVSEKGLKSLAYFNDFSDKPRLKSTNNKKVDNLFESQPIIPNDPLPAPSEKTHLLKSDNQLADKDTRSELTNKLKIYVNRIESYKNMNENKIDFSHGFWFFAQSRAINRRANYLLAKCLIKRLESDTVSVQTIFSDINKQRSFQLQTRGLHEYADFVDRGINSKELNSIIQSGITILNESSSASVII